MLPQYPLHPATFPSLSCPFGTPDLLQARTADVLVLSTRLDAARVGTCVGVWRSRVVVPGRADLGNATTAATSLSKGRYGFPINTFQLALTFSFPGSNILFRPLRSWVPFVTVLRSWAVSIRRCFSTPLLVESLESVILFEKPVLGPLHGR